MVRAFLILIATLLFATPCLAQDSIVLRAEAKVESVRAITLGDIATLSGPEASRLSNSIVADASKARVIEGGTLSLDVAAVRDALAKSGIKWGKVSLSGGTCRISLGEAPKAAPVAKPVPPPTARSPSRPPEPPSACPSRFGSTRMASS
jgi:hypothetical protein